MKKQSVQNWKAAIQPVLQSKEKEFHSLGFHDVTANDIWHCLLKHIWKHDQEKRLHEVVQDIFHLQASTYMNYARIGALQGQENDLIASIQALTETEDEA